jgi:hypothetical protein
MKEDHFGPYKNHSEDEMKKVLMFCVVLALFACALPSMATLTGENCAHPKLVAALNYADSGSTCSFNDNTNYNCGGATSPGKDVVYKYISPVDQRASISLCGSSFNTLLYVYNGTCTSGNVIACNNNSDVCGTGSNRSYIECLQMLANHTYYIVVDATDYSRDDGEGDGDGEVEGDGAERCPCGNYRIQLTLCNEPPVVEYDMGDLSACSYPTLVNNPAHAITGIAFLGDLVTSEDAPNSYDLDAGDDGVDFLDQPWVPCHPANVQVKVTAGENYQAYADSGKHLYLNAWKDGNLDGDFCDTLCNGVLEWILRDVIVVPSATPYIFQVMDPGRQDLFLYEGIFRFRLTSRPVGQFGFGLVDRTSCQGMTCGTFDVDYLGEVEDYVMEDLQLAVELGTFDAIAGQNRVTLRWNTLSESNNDHFEVERNGNVITRVAGLGDSPSGHTYAWVDNTVQASVTYTYTLYDVDLDGTRRQMATASATPASEPLTITEYTLYQNYPNPFNPTTSIMFDLVESGTVTLTVYNPMGQQVALLVNGSLNAGRHTVTFYASDLPSGMYLYHLEAQGFSATQKMLLMK